MTKCGSGGWADVSTRRSPKAVKLRGSFKTFAMECLGVKGVFAEAAGQFCGISRSTIKRWAKEVQPRKRKRTALFPLKRTCFGNSARHTGTS